MEACNVKVASFFVSYREAGTQRQDTKPSVFILFWLHRGFVSPGFPSLIHGES